MVAIKDVRASNATLKSKGPGQVSVFVGATSGIGYATVIQLATHLDAPKIYLVGRSKTKLSQVSSELQSINSEASVETIVAETSLLQQVDIACKEISQNEAKVDLLYMSTGYLSFERTFTSEGLDEEPSLKCYSRLRFIHNLLPLFTKSTSPRVVSILAGGKEGKVFTNDLELRQNYSMTNSMGHFCTMQTLSLEQIAKKHPELSILHVYPGYVNTGTADRCLDTAKGSIAHSLAQLAKYLVLPIGSIFATSMKEAGERGLYHATSPRYPSRKEIEELESPSVGVSKLKGKDGVMECSVDNNGVYLLDSNSESVRNEKVLAPYRGDGVDLKLWEHIEETFDRVTSRS